jgi:hypothetical protein
VNPYAAGPSFTDHLQAEADRLYPPDHQVDDPEGATGVARSDEYGYDATANRAFVEGGTFAVDSIEPGCCCAPAERWYHVVGRWVGSIARIAIGATIALTLGISIGATVMERALTELGYLP